ncbi:hypothetical protein EC968_007278 [Mortierella alpina]|nr:hypothetical protein EC968_007278 [Mortierella alpina]
MKADVGILTEIRLKPLNITLKPPGGAEFSLASPHMEADVLTPSFLPSWPVKRSKQRATVEYNGIDIASLETAMSDSNVMGNIVSKTLPPADLSIIVGAEASFSAFIAALIMLPAVNFRLKGTLDAALEIPAKFPMSEFKFVIPGLAYNAGVTLAGGNGFSGIKFSKLISFTQDPTSKKFILEADVTLNNPSDLVLKLGAFKFQSKDQQGNVVGTFAIKSYDLEQGLNELRATITSEGANPDGLLKVLTTTGATLTLSGYEGSSANKILADGMLKFETTITLPTLPAPSTV